MSEAMAAGPPASDIRKLREQLAAELEENCGWIRDINDVYHEMGFDEGPEAWLHSMLYSRYELYGYIMFGDVWGKKLDWALDHMIDTLDLEDEEQEALYELVDSFDTTKIDSIHKVMKECKELKNMKMKDFPGLGAWINDMAELGYEGFKEAAEMTFPEFITSRIWEDLADIVKKAVDEEENEDLDEEEKKDLEREVEGFQDSVEDLITIGPDITWTLEKEITKLLTERLDLSTCAVEYMLGCLENCYRCSGV